MKVAITGAAGFVGAALKDEILKRTNWEVLALSRSARPAEDRLEWREVDLFSLGESKAALTGADVAVYLVHSMLPSARLSQGNFTDWDAILADNFARSAKKAGVKLILYLGGIIPEGELSPHLASRKEVEGILGAQRIPLTVFRAGLVVGKGGSSFVLLTRLVRRLPVMLCPSWTATPTQPVDIRSLVDAMIRTIDSKSLWGRSFDIGAPEPTNYKEMMGIVARKLGVRRRVFSVPLFSPGFSRLWVSLVTGAPRALVAPLVKSLRHPMVVHPDRAFRAEGWRAIPFEQSVRDFLTEPSQSPRAFQSSQSRRGSEVQSVQRLPLPLGWNAGQAVTTFMEWLPRFFRGVIRVDHEAEMIQFRIWGLSHPLLQLRRDLARSVWDRQILWITGGWLARDTDRGFLEFRLTVCGDSLLAAIHRYRPALPWFVYRSSQALIHVWVMSSFGRFLRTQVAPPPWQSQGEEVPQS